MAPGAVLRIEPDKVFVVPQAAAAALPAATPRHGHVHRVIIKFVCALSATCAGFSTVSGGNHVHHVVVASDPTPSVERVNEAVCHRVLPDERVVLDEYKLVSAEPRIIGP